MTNALPGMITNTSGFTNLVISTCDPANGTNLVTGILIQNVFLPPNYLCATNNTGCSSSTNLSTATISMSLSQTTSAYRTSIFYKGATTNGLTNIVVNWTYQ